MKRRRNRRAGEPSRLATPLLWTPHQASSSSSALWYSQWCWKILHCLYSFSSFQLELALMALLCSQQGHLSQYSRQKHYAPRSFQPGWQSIALQNLRESFEWLHQCQKVQTQVPLVYLLKALWFQQLGEKCWRLCWWTVWIDLPSCPEAKLLPRTIRDADKGWLNQRRSSLGTIT